MSLLYRRECFCHVRSIIESGSVIDNNAVVKGGKVNGYVGIGSVISERCDINSAVGMPWGCP